MAKIDVSTIEGYAEMTAEEKVAALEAMELAEPDYSGYVSKATFDKTSTELANAKKQLKTSLSEEQSRQQAQEEQIAQLQASYDALVKQNKVSEATAKYISLGYDEALATETASALIDGNTEKVFENQQKFLTAYKKSVKAETLKSTPSPVKDGDSAVMTLAKFKKLSAQERYQFSQKHADEYKQLYGASDTASE